jgi:hypothetical protein
MVLNDRSNSSENRESAMSAMFAMSANSKKVAISEKRAVFVEPGAWQSLDSRQPWSPGGI